MPAPDPGRAGGTARKIRMNDRDTPRPPAGTRGVSHIPQGGLADVHRVGMVAQLSDDVWRRLVAACIGTRQMGPRECLTKAGTEVSHSALLLDGMITRYVENARGDRLMVALQVPGDFVDLHGLPLGHLDHDVCSLGTARVALFPHGALRGIMSESVEHARELWRLTMIDASIHRHWTFRIGRLRAAPALANFLCEMDLRARLSGFGTDRGYALGLTQTDLAEVCGLSAVHVSRVLKELRDGGLCNLRDGFIEITDRNGLMRLAGFDPGYLYLPWGDASAET